jgi:hypothetical protein
MRGNRRHLALHAVLAVVAILAIPWAFAQVAAAEQSVSIPPVGNLQLTLSGGFNPRVLPKTEPTPAALRLSAKISNRDGSLPPALKELTLEIDKSAAINVKGLAVCQHGVQYHSLSDLRANCRDARVGGGTAAFQIQFPEQTPILAKSKMLIFNGGLKEGVTTLYADAYLAVPTPAVLTMTAKLRKIHQGRYGTQMAISVPKLADGYGSLTSFKAAIGGKLSFEGRKASVLTLKCPDGEISTRGDALFVDGTLLQAEFQSPCAARRVKRSPVLSWPGLVTNLHRRARTRRASSRANWSSPRHRDSQLPASLEMPQHQSRVEGLGENRSASTHRADPPVLRSQGDRTGDEDRASPHLDLRFPVDQLRENRANRLSTRYRGGVGGDQAGVSGEAVGRRVELSGVDCFHKSHRAELGQGGRCELRDGCHVTYGRCSDVRRCR